MTEHYFYILAGLTILLVRIPFVGKVLRITNTMVHESGHALMALVTSGSVVSIDLFHDTSGNAVTKSANWFSKVMVALAGYVTSSLTAYVLFALLKEEHYNFIAYILTALAALNIVFWVRNAYGLLWLACFIGLNGWFLYSKNAEALQVCDIVFSTAILAESFFSAFVILYISFTNSNNAGDAKNLKEFTKIPAVLWGLLFAAQASYFVYLVVKLYKS